MSTPWEFWTSAKAWAMQHTQCLHPSPSHHHSDGGDFNHTRTVPNYPLCMYYIIHFPFFPLSIIQYLVYINVLFSIKTILHFVLSKVALYFSLSMIHHPWSVVIFHDWLPIFRHLFSIIHSTYVFSITNYLSPTTQYLLSIIQDLLSIIYIY